MCELPPGGGRPDESQARWEIRFSEIWEANIEITVECDSGDLAS